MATAPQENWEEEKRFPFYIALETEIEKAELAGKSVLVELDANAKLGSKYIPRDPHAITPSGLLLAGIIERHSLNVGNGSQQCRGTITRKRVTKYHTEESVIDIVLFSHDLRKHFVAMHIDEERKHVLTQIRKTKNGVKIKESDHNVMFAEFNCKIVEKDEDMKEEAYNLKNMKCQANFKRYTSNTNMLTSTINDEDDINEVIKRFLKKVDGCIATNFKRRRVKRNKVENNDKLYDKMRTLKGKEYTESKKELAKCVESIASLADKNF